MMQAFQDINKMYYEHTRKQKTPSSFIFFRNPDEKIGKLSDLCGVGKRNDAEPDLRNALLSASISCTDHTRLESALYFFAKNTNAILMLGEHNELFNSLYALGVKSTTVEKIKAVYQNAPASFIQLFLPRKQEQLFKEYMYISKAFGLRSEGARSVVDHIDYMRQHPTEALGGWIYQLRIALGADYFANPKSGIRMVRFQDINKAAAFGPMRQQVLAEVRKDIQEYASTINSLD